VIVIKYINHYEGNYDQTGTITEFDAKGVQTTSTALKNVIAFTTVALDTCLTDGILDKIDKAYQVKIIVNSDKTVSFSNTANSTANQIVSNGSNTYDPATSTFTLNYKILSSTGAYKTASAKMVWRNRVRDGINEWRR
jgi:hypothetical protein